MKLLKGLVLGLVLLVALPALASEKELSFNYFNAAAYPTGGTWEAFMLTTIVDENNKPVENAVITATWDYNDIEICRTNKTGDCKFSNYDIKENTTIFAIESVDKKDYTYVDGHMTMMIVGPQGEM